MSEFLWTSHAVIINAYYLTFICIFIKVYNIVHSFQYNNWKHNSSCFFLFNHLPDFWVFPLVCFILTTLKSLHYMKLSDGRKLKSDQEKADGCQISKRNVRESLQWKKKNLSVSWRKLANQRIGQKNSKWTETKTMFRIPSIFLRDGVHLNIM